MPVPVNSNVMRIATPVNTTISIVGILVLGFVLGLVLPRLIGNSDSAKIKAAESRLNRLSMSIVAYKLDVGYLPSDLDALVSHTAQLDGWRGPYVKRSLLTGPWGNSVLYEPAETYFELTNYGPDNKSGGKNQNADIVVHTHVRDTAHNESLHTDASDAGAG